MHRILGRYADQVYAIFRIVVGFLFSFHGCQKLFGCLTDDPPVPLASLMGLGGIIEFFGGLLVMLGLCTSWAAFLASGMMAVAYFMVHQPQGTWPIKNGGETAVLYCFAFLYIAARGAGPWSIARALRKPSLE
jgi:putative oxidoreductase